MIIKNILEPRPDGGQEIWFNNTYDDVEGFLRIAEFLIKKYNGKIVHKISVDIDLWEFDFEGNRLNLVGDGLDNRLVALTSESFHLLKQIFQDIDSGEVEKTLSSTN
jgi:hypothetical protein